MGSLVSACRNALKECKVEDSNIFETTVPGSFELPLAARFLALSGTVDAIVCAGVLIKGDTMHFEYIADAVAKGIMNVGIQTNVPIVFGVLTCLNEDQVKARSSGSSNHGYDWGKTGRSFFDSLGMEEAQVPTLTRRSLLSFSFVAVEMALLRSEAMGEGEKSAAVEQLAAIGFSGKTDEAQKKKSPGFF